MLNRLCAYHLNRATSRQQTRVQISEQLSQNRDFFEKCSQILIELKMEIQGQEKEPLSEAEADEAGQQTKASQADLMDRFKSN